MAQRTMLALQAEHTNIRHICSTYTHHETPLLHRTRTHRG